MSQKIYVGNLNYATTEETLANLFSQFGEVVSSIVIKDKMSGQSKGFGFVEMADEGIVQNVISSLNGKDLEGRRLRVNMAEEKPRQFKPRGDFNNRNNYRDNNRSFNDNYRY